MAACKAMLDAAHGVAGSSMVTAMARNGVEFGIRVSGTGDRWFTAPAPVVDGLYFPGYTDRGRGARSRRQRDHRDRRSGRLRDGGGAGDRQVRRRHAAGRDRQHAGDDPHHARPERRLHAAGARISPARRPASTSRKVVDTGILPIINTGIAHREAGVGQIGAGITRAPLACFTQAVSALASAMRGSQ